MHMFIYYSTEYSSSISDISCELIKKYIHIIFDMESEFNKISKKLLDWKKWMEQINIYVYELLISIDQDFNKLGYIQFELNNIKILRRE